MRDMRELMDKNMITPAYPIASQVDEMRRMTDAAERLSRAANLTEKYPGLDWLIFKIGAHLHDLGSTIDRAELRPWREPRSKPNRGRKQGSAGGEGAYRAEIRRSSRPSGQKRPALDRKRPGVEQKRSHTTQSQRRR